jgi:hypothetical protein
MGNKACRHNFCSKPVPCNAGKMDVIENSLKQTGCGRRTTTTTTKLVRIRIQWHASTEDVWAFEYCHESEPHVFRISHLHDTSSSQKTLHETHFSKDGSSIPAFIAYLNDDFPHSMPYGWEIKICLFKNSVCSLKCVRTSDGGIYK